jgi:hypothetical protein
MATQQEIEGAGADGVVEPGSESLTVIDNRTGQR